MAYTYRPLGDVLDDLSASLAAVQQQIKDLEQVHGRPPYAMAMAGELLPIHRLVQKTLRDCRRLERRWGAVAEALTTGPFFTVQGTCYYQAGDRERLARYGMQDPTKDEWPREITVHDAHVVDRQSGMITWFGQAVIARGIWVVFVGRTWGQETEPPEDWSVL